MKGCPDAPTREEVEWAVPLGISPAAWSVRMHLLADMVGDEGRGAADLGCGHGLLALGLVSSGRRRHAIGIDRSEPEVEVARENVIRAQETIIRAASSTEAPLPPSLAVDIRLGDGAEPLTREDDVDTLIIAGIGAQTMMRVLTPAKSMGDETNSGDGEEAVSGEMRGEFRVSGVDQPLTSIERLVLNPPAKDAQTIRGFLSRSGAWIIDDEQLCVENEQMHVMISASRSDRASISASSSSSSKCDDAEMAATSGSSKVWEPFVELDGDVEGASSSWKPSADDVIQWVGVKGDVMDLDELADEIIGPVLRRRRPPLLKVYLRDRLDWFEGKRRAVKLSLSKLLLERRVLSEDESDKLESIARKEVALREEVRWLGASITLMASLLGELELEEYLR